jgi:hypothetical protein
LGLTLTTTALWFGGQRVTNATPPARRPRHRP